VAQRSLPNPLGIHALVWVGDTSSASVDHAIAKTKETGYDLLELSLHDTANLDVATARRRLTDAGLRVVCSRGLAFDADISSEDPLARQALVLADDIGEDNILIHLDTYHMNIEEDDLVRPVREVGDRLGYVHVGENHRGYLGSGHLDFTAFFHALADIGYTGPITFESFSSAVVAAGLSSDLAIWRNLWSDGEDLARHARIFIANHLTPAGAS
jgi:D-psicose/D-tagatose/L-ribulose 3-epimerase